MNLYLIRHADAGDPKQWQGDDADRPLSDLGRRQARALGEAFRRLGLTVGAVVTSPYVRTRQTAEEFLADGPAGVATLDSYLLTPGGLRRRRLSKEVAEPKADHVAVVGHNPELSAYLAWLIGAEEEAAAMEKGGAALVTFDNRPRKGAGRLAWVITPDWYMPAAE
ncbi:MAG: histidine phosphatase family protein [Gemmataceae bacterium]|nr:histidine phosphatase family protein [Gemmataceae bacterium]